ncbi:MFS transporter [Halalkalibacter lacteus]|uniref:MFS transporter n=1 Tax=Halalkalibacter lacteus TaxID=3090663 RepID=UPI002FCC6F2F
MQVAAEHVQKEVPDATKKDHIIFLSTVFCFWFSTYIYIPVFGLHLENIGFSYSFIGIILGSYGVTQILLRFPLGVISDHLIGLRKQLLIFGFFVALASSLLLLFSNTFFAIFTARLLAGVTAAMWVMATVLYSQYFHSDQASKAMSRIQFLTVFAQFSSMIISGYLVLYFGWSFPFWVAAVTSIIGIFLAFRIKEVSYPSRPSRKQEFHILSHIKKTYRLKGLKTITFLSLSAHSILFITIFGFSPMYATHLSEATYAVTILICAFFIPHALASVWLMFYKVDLQKQKKVLLFCFCATSIFLFFIPLTNSLFTLCFIHAGIGLTLGIIFPLLLGMVIQVSITDLKNSAMGFYQSFYAVGILIGPLFAGEIAERAELIFVFYLCGFLSIIATIVVLFMARTKG